MPDPSMHDERLARLQPVALRQHGAFNRDDALRAGWSSSSLQRMVSAGAFIRTARGVYSFPGHPSTPWHRASVALLVAGEGAALSHMSASAAWGLTTWPPRPHVSLAYPRRATVPDAQMHRSRALRGSDVVVRNGLRVTSVDRTLVDCAALLDRAALTTMVDEALRAGLTSGSRLKAHASLLRRSSVPGCKRVLEVLATRPHGAGSHDSVLETQFLRLVEAAGLSDPEHNFPVRVGEARFRIDFAWPELGLAVELDGARFHDHEHRRDADLDRQNRLVAAGWIVIRFRWAHVTRDREITVARLRDAMAACRRRQGLPDGGLRAAGADRGADLLVTGGSS